MADFDGSMIRAKLTNLALDWCDGSDKAVRDALGDSVSAYDRSLFYVAACAEMGARAYDMLAKDEGLADRAEMPEVSALSVEERRMVAEAAAQRLLQTAFTLLGARIRVKGHDVQVSAKLSFSKVDNFRRKEGPAAEPPQGGCRCALDQDGQCAECAGLARGFLMAILESTRAMMKFDRSRPICPACAKVCLDRVFAKVIRDEFTGMDPAAAENFMNGLLVGSQSLVAMELPLTKRAWAEVQRGGRA